MIDSWEDSLIPLLEEELEETTSIQERVVSASLKAIDPSLREGVDALFTLFGVFPEDAIVPARPDACRRPP